MSRQHCLSLTFKDDNSCPSNGPNLVPIPPAYIRDARYQGDARYAMTILLASNALTLAFCFQGETDFDRHFTGSPLQFSVRLFYMTLHETVEDSFSPKAFIPIPRVDGVDSPRRQRLRLQYRGRWDFCRHRGSCYRSRCCGAVGNLRGKA